MAQNDNKKIIPLDILKILKEYTDDEHYIMQKDMVKKLQDMGYYTLDKKTVMNNINSLISAGYEIEYEKSKRTNSGYHLLKNTDDELDDEELRILIDTVLSSKHIPAIDAKYIIDKLKKLGNSFFRKKTGNILNYNDFYHTNNSDVFNNIKRINEAMNDKKKIGFSLCKYNSKLELIPYEKMIFNPYTLFSVNGKYVVLGNVEESNTIMNYDISKIMDLTILSEDIKPQHKTELGNQSITSYINSHPSLKNGICEIVKLEFNEKILDDFIDTFGLNQRVREIEKEDGLKFIEANLRANKKDIINFVLLHSSDVRVIAPQSLRDEIRNISINIKIDYSETNQDKYNIAVQKFKLSTELYNYFVVENELNLDNIDLSNLSDFSEIKEVCKLCLSKNNISDFSFLKELKNLHYLTIRENRIESLDFIKYLPELQVLNLYWNDIENISALKDNLALRSLTICLKEKTDLSILNELKNLEYLEIEGQKLNLNLSIIKQNNPALILTTTEDNNHIMSKKIYALDYSIDVNSTGLKENEFIKNLFLYTFGKLERYQVDYPNEELKNDIEFKQKLNYIFKDVEDNKKLYLMDTFKGKTLKEIATSLNVSIGELINNSIENEMKIKDKMKKTFKGYIDYNKYLKGEKKYIFEKDETRIKKIMQQRKRNRKITDNL